MTYSWKGKRVLVTGADGFMGSHLTDRLLAAGADVSIFVRGNSVNGSVKYTLKNLAGREKKFRAILTGDIGSPDSITLIKKSMHPTSFSTSRPTRTSRIRSSTRARSWNRTSGAR